MITKDELNMIVELWKRDWANDKAKEAFRQECVRVCKYFAKVDPAYNSYAIFELLPDLKLIKVSLEISRNVYYIRYIPLRSLLVAPEVLCDKELCVTLLREGNSIWVKSEKEKE